MTTPHFPWHRISLFLSRKDFFVVLSLLLVAVAFVPFLHGNFVWDDVHLIENNPAMQRDDGFYAILGHDLWGQATGKRTQLYHPLPMLTLWAQARLTGVRVAPLRFGNLILHIIAVALFVIWLERRKLPTGLALAAGLVVLVHPSVTEPVMWLTGRHDSLAVVCALCGLLLWTGSETEALAGRAFGAGLLFAAAFLCKEQYIVLPALPLLWTSSRLLLERYRPPVSGLFAIGLIFLPLIGVIGIRTGLLGISLGATQAGAPLDEQAIHFASVVAHYTAQLASFENSPTIAPYRALAPEAALAVWALLLLASVVLGRRVVRGAAHGRLAWQGWIWYLLALAPHVVSVPSIGLYGNRYGYFALFGLAVCAASLAASIPLAMTPGRRALYLCVLLFACTGLTFRTGREASHFRSNLELFGADLERDPGNGHALYHYATAVVRSAGCREALPLFIRATELAPSYKRPWHNAAGCAINLGHARMAVRFARRAVELAPRDPGAQYNLGLSLLSIGQREAGVAHLQRAVQLSPGYERARRLLRNLRSESPADRNERVR